ncbi:hypothetical protein [Pleionea sediminis]|uniref:hypothetical protein n=1 Tax=Pleionea sediminis TaxID=2569479 RepID=UPI001186479B|nr:hypothetical protein [Pleionea sediminis]
MNNFRVFLSISVFSISLYLIFDLIIYSFDWILLLLSVVGFACAHYLWPPKQDDESAWYDMLEIIVEFPFRAIALFFRELFKIFKNTDSDFDL